MTEHPTSHKSPQQGVGPADPRGALLRTPEPLPTPPATALPAQTRAGGEAPSSGPLSCAKQGPPGNPGGTSSPLPATGGSEHSQPAAEEPGTHRPRPVPEGIPAQPGGEQDRVSAPPGGKDRRTGQSPMPHGPMPMRRDGDRLRFVGAATRRIARGIDLDEIVMGLCRATVPTFSDAILVYLRDPLPVGDERPTGPLVLRLRRTDRIPQERDLEDGILPVPVPESSGLVALSSELCEVRPGGALAEVLRGGPSGLRGRARRPRGAARAARRRHHGPRGPAGDPRSAARPPQGHRRRALPAPPRPAGVRGGRPAGRRAARHAQRARHRQGGAVRP
ncbi:hypothetical protein GCM10022207_65450 [Streptomyces lannensis]|uniref:Serine/threonine protein phosphatase n=1 Tax=Streptomyces lannensis TaxID=766498 RepID=A0ABP7KYB0_9ACTN